MASWHITDNCLLGVCQVCTGSVELNILRVWQ